MKNFDLFGIEIPLYYNKNSKYKSSLGGILSLSVIVFGFVLCFYFGNNLLKKKNPQVTTITKEVSNLEITLRKNDNFFYFGIYSISNKTHFYNESFFVLSAKLFFYDVFENSEIILNFERCSKKNVPNFNEEIQDSFAYIYNMTYFCFDLISQKKLKLINTQKTFQSFAIFLSPCKNNSNQRCASKNDMRKVLNDLQLDLAFTNNNLNILNYKEVKNQEIKYFTYKIYPTETNEVQIKFNQLELITDNGFFFENKYSQIFTHFHSSKKEIHQNDGKHLLSIEIMADLSLVTTTRIYDKIPKILAEVGGVLNLYILCIKICFQPFLRIIFLKEIINEHYYIQTLEDENNNNIKDKNLKIKKNTKKIKLDLKNKKKKNIYDICDTVSDSKKNEVENIKYPISMFKNYLQRKYIKFKTSFHEIFCNMISKKSKKNQKKKNLDKIIKDFESIFEIKTLIKKIKEIDVIKELIFDENQKQIIDFCPIYFEDKYEKNINNFNNCMKEKLDLIKQKNNKSDIDFKILSKFFEFE